MKIFATVFFLTELPSVNSCHITEFGSNGLHPAPGEFSLAPGSSRRDDADLAGDSAEGPGKPSWGLQSPTATSPTADAGGEHWDPKGEPALTESWKVC